MKRFIIYQKDIQIITGRGEKYARGMMSRIRKKFKKDAEQLITVDEFCVFSGLSKEEVEKRLY
jgi:hypothetical protein